MRTFFEEVQIATVQDLETQSHSLRPDLGWAFRGHKNRRFGLSTTLHLACDRHGIAGATIVETERMLLREFARKAHLYIRDGAELPHTDDTLEWMSLMRHYGAPTRLLDWTYSLFVAAYFALDSTDPGARGFIWAINTRWLNGLANKTLRGRLNKGAVGDIDKTGEHFRKFFMARRPKSFVSTENPYRLNARLAIQQAVFLCLGNVTETFEENLLAMLDDEEERQAYELVLPDSPAFRSDLIHLLARQNINTEVLFPGLEGLAKALRDRIPQLRSIGIENRGNMACLGRAPNKDTPKTR